MARQNRLPTRLATLATLLAVSPAAAQELLWERTFGPGSGDGLAVANDGAGGVLVGGTTGDYDAWLLKFDGSGTRLWSRTFGTPDVDLVQSLAPDGSGGCFAAGTTGGSLGGPNAGLRDVWLSHHDGTGEQRWIVQIGSADDEFLASVAPDGAGGAFFAGMYAVARYDSQGNRLWVRSYGDLGGAPWVVGADGAGGVFVGGRSSPYTAWITRLNLDGGSDWVSTVPGNWLTFQPYTDGVCSDGAGGAYAAGGYSSHFYTTGGWVAHFDATGVRMWYHRFVDEFRASCTPDGAGGVVLGGWPVRRFDAMGLELWSRVPGIGAVASDGGGGFFGVVGNTLTHFGPCYPNCDLSTAAPTLNIADFMCFLNAFAADLPYANCDQSTIPPTLNTLDFACFLNRFAAGCP